MALDVSLIRGDNLRKGLIHDESCPREREVGAGRYAVPALVRESPLAWTPQLARSASMC